MQLRATRLQEMTASLRKLLMQFDPAQRTGAWYVILIVTMGLVGGFVGIGYRLLLSLFQIIYYGSTDPVIAIAARLPWYLCLVAPAAGALVAALVIRYGLRGAQGEGMSEMMEAITLRERTLGVRASLWKGLSSLIAIGSGGSIGREGPMAQISTAVAGRISERLRLPADRSRILMGCGMAAGMAAAYNTPIGASLFVMEVIIGNFAMEIFGPLVVAAVVSTLLTRGLAGGAIYEVPELRLVSGWEFVPYVALGLLCAFVGPLFIDVLRGTTWSFSKLPVPPWARATLGGLLLGAVAIRVPHVLGTGADGVNLMLRSEMALGLLGLALAGKLLATSLSLGSGSSGGVFTPVLFMGAALGGLVGTVAGEIWPSHVASPAAYSLVGMSGLLASTMHAPLMATLMILEMTLNYNLILPVLVCCGVSAMVSRAIKRDSIYTDKLRRRGVDIDLAIEESALQSIKVEEVMWTEPPTVTPDTSLRKLLDRFLTMRGQNIHVVDSERRYHGIIDVQDLVAAADQRQVGDLVIAGDLARRLPHVEEGDPVARVMEKFWFGEHGESPVLSRAAPQRFLGVVTRRDILRAFDREVLQRKLMTTRYEPGATGRRLRRSTVDLPDEFAIEELPVPDALLGHTLLDLDLPHRYLLTVLALKRGNGNKADMIPPPADVKLVAGDRLVLVGRRTDVNRFSRS